MSRKPGGLALRMMGYEATSEHLLTPRMPLIIRCDGRAFHTFARGLEFPWNE